MNKRTLLFIGLIITVSIFFRFYNYQNRWGLAYDQAHDYLVARYALDAHKIPLVGPFSSAGPFQTGGQWYWIIMFGMMFFDFAYNGPWIFMTLLSVLFVIIMMKLAYEMYGISFAIIAGVLSALSPAQVSQSVHLTNQSPLSLISLFALWFGYRHLSSKSFISAYLFGFFVVLAPMIHLSGLLLFVFAFVFIIMSGLPSRVSVLGYVLGGMSSVFPFVYYDIHHNFYNITHMIRYIFFEKNPITYEALGRRWLTYLTDLIPRQLGRITGGNSGIGVLLFVFAFVVSFLESVKKRFNFINTISISSVIIFFIIRYIKTPLYDSYFVFLHPFILLMGAYVIFWIVERKRNIGLVVFSIVTVFLILASTRELTASSNTLYGSVVSGTSMLTTLYPNQKFAVYDYVYKTAGFSLPLSSYLSYRGLISESGIPIGIRVASTSATQTPDIVVGNLGSYELLDLGLQVQTGGIKEQWFRVNSFDVYRSTEEWNDNVSSLE